MFGSLKKKLKDAIDKVSGRLAKEPLEKKPEYKEPVVEEELQSQPALKEKAMEKPEHALKEEPMIKKPEPDEPLIEETMPLKEPVESEPVTKEPALEEHKPIDKPEHALKEEPIEKPKPIEKQEPAKPPKEGVSEEIKLIEEKTIDKPEHALKEEPQPVVKKEKRGLFRKITEKELTEDDIDKILPELQKTLLANDVALEVVDKILNEMKNILKGKSVGRRSIEAVIKNSLKDAISSAMEQEDINLVETVKNSKKPFVMLFLGFNGTGKTTSLAKIASLLKDNNLSSVMVAADTFRAASIEQIQEHADSLGIKLIKQQYGADPAAVVFDGIKYAEAHKIKAVLCDSAGRSHSNVNLMDELEKITRVNKPDMKILVLDSLTGNDIYDQAHLFDKAVGVDAVILTKADVYDKGGAALSVAHTLKKPIIFLATGQGYEDLLPFDAEKIAEQLFN